MGTEKTQIYADDGRCTQMGKDKPQISQIAQISCVFSLCLCALRASVFLPGTSSTDDTDLHRWGEERRWPPILADAHSIRALQETRTSQVRVSWEACLLAVLAFSSWRPWRLSLGPYPSTLFAAFEFPLVHCDNFGHDAQGNGFGGVA